MNVRDVMTRQPVVIRPDATVEDAVALMRRGRFRHLPVVEGDALVGVISDRDFRPLDAASDRDARGRSIRSLMTRHVLTIAPDDPLEDAARIMLDNKVGCLPALDGDALVGIVTESDIFRAFVDVLGVMEPGTRVQITTPDIAGALVRIAEVAKAQGAPILSIVSYPAAAEGHARLVLRFRTLIIGRLTERLRAAGLDVVDPDPTNDHAVR